jgi:hypothetical protein
MDQFHSTAILIRVAIEAIFWFGDLQRGVLTWMPMSLYKVVARCFASDEKLPLGPFDRSAANQLQEPKIEISIDRIGPIQSLLRLYSRYGHRIAQPPKATLVTRLQPSRSPGQAARQLPDQSTTLRVDSSSTDDSRLRGAQPSTDMESGGIRQTMELFQNIGFDSAH